MDLNDKISIHVETCRRCSQRLLNFLNKFFSMFQFVYLLKKGYKFSESIFVDWKNVHSQVTLKPAEIQPGSSQPPISFLPFQYLNCDD